MALSRDNKNIRFDFNTDDIEFHSSDEIEYEDEDLEEEVEYEIEDEDDYDSEDEIVSFFATLISLDLYNIFCVFH